MYCVYCGVKLQDGVKECPLCRTPVMIAQETAAGDRSSYSDRLPEKEKTGRGLLVWMLTAVMIAADRLPEKEKTGRGLLVWMLTAVMIAAGLSSLIVCLNTAGEASWSGYVLMGGALAWIVVLFPLLFPRFRPMIFLPIDFVCLAGFLLYVCLKNGENWFLSFAFPVTGIACILFPVTGIACILTLLGVTIFRYIRKGRLRLLGLYLVLIGCSFMLVEFFQSITFHTPMWVWSLYCVCGFGLLGLFLFIATLIPPLHAHLRKTFFF